MPSLTRKPLHICISLNLPNLPNLLAYLSILDTCSVYYNSSSFSACWKLFQLTIATPILAPLLKLLDCLATVWGKVTKMDTYLITKSPIATYLSECTLAPTNLVFWKLRHGLPA